MPKKTCKFISGVHCTHKDGTDCTKVCSALDAYAIGVVTTARSIVEMIGHFAPDGSLFNLQSLIKEKYHLVPSNPAPDPVPEVVDGPAPQPPLPTPPQDVVDAEVVEEK